MTRVRQVRIMVHMTHAASPAAPEITLGWRLRMAMEFADIKADDMARDLGVHRGTISRWTHDVGAPPRGIYLQRWAELCNVSLDWLSAGLSRSGNTSQDSGSDIPRFADHALVA